MFLFTATLLFLSSLSTVCMNQMPLRTIPIYLSEDTVRRQILDLQLRKDNIQATLNEQEFSERELFGLNTKLAAIDDRIEQLEKQLDVFIDQTP